MSHEATMKILRDRLSQADGIEKKAFEPMQPGMPPNSPEAMAAMPPPQAAPPMDPAMGGAPMDPAMGGMPPVDPAMGGAPMDPAMMAPPMDPAMGGMPMDPAMMAPPMDPAMGGMPPVDPAMAGTPVTLTLEDLKMVMSEMMPAKEEEPAEGGRVTNKDLGASVEALTQTVNAMAGSLGIDPVAISGEQNPAEAAAAMGNEPIPAPEALLGPEEAAMMEAEPPPMIDPAMAAPMDPAAMPPPMPAPPMDPAMMQMTASAYQDSDKPVEGNRVAHMLLNLKARR